MSSTSNKPLVCVVTGSDSGFGQLTARSLAQAGYIVYGGLFHPNDGSSSSYNDVAEWAKQNNCDLRGIHLNIVNDDIIQQAVSQIIEEEGRIDVVVHNAGHMSLGPAESFTPAQFLDLYDVNCVGCHRLNSAVLPYMRERGSGLLVWVTSGSVHGPSSPFLAPYFAAKAAQDSLAQTMALEVSQWGIETSIVIPGIFTSGTNHFGSAMKPGRPDIAKAYLEDGPYKGWMDTCLEGSANMSVVDMEPQAMGDAIVNVVNMEFGKRPWRVHVEPEGPIAESVNRVRDEMREKYLTRMGCAELMKVKLR